MLVVLGHTVRSLVYQQVLEVVEYLGHIRRQKNLRYICIFLKVANCTTLILLYP